MSYAARGELGLIWRLETPTGRWAVKELLHPEDETGGDLNFQLAALEADVPMPRPRSTPSGDAIAPLPGGQQVRVYEWVDIDPNARCPPARAGELLAAIHSIRHPAGPSHPFYREPPRPSEWDELKHLCDSHLGAPTHDWAGHLAPFLSELRETSETLPRPDQVTGHLTRCHLDYYPDNVLVDLSGRALVIDWENSAAADPQQEVPLSAADFMAVAPEELGLAPAVDFVEGYRRSGGHFQPQALPAFSLAFTVQANIVLLHARWAVDLTESDDRRDRSRNALNKITSRLLTPTLAEDLLAAWR